MLYKKIFIYNCHLKPLLIFYFSFFLFKNFGKGCKRVYDCYPDCCKKYWNKYFNKNKPWIKPIKKEVNVNNNFNPINYDEDEKLKNFLITYDINEKYLEEENITPENFDLNKTLKNYKQWDGTYLLTIF